MVQNISLDHRLIRFGIYLTLNQIYVSNELIKKENWKGNLILWQSYIS